MENCGNKNCYHSFDASLMERFVRSLTVMQEQTYAMAKEKYTAVFEKLKSRMTILQTLLQSYAVERDERENLCHGENEGSSNAEVSATEAMEVDVPEGSPDLVFEKRVRLPNSYSKLDVHNTRTPYQCWKETVT